MTASSVPSVLFVCVHNAGRSQLAAALLAHHAAGAVEVRSAGSAPADTINPAVHTVLSELGIDVSGQHPKLLTADAVEASDVVVTMGCGDACSVYPGKRYLDWSVPDPAGRVQADEGGPPGAERRNPSGQRPRVCRGGPGRSQPQGRAEHGRDPAGQAAAGQPPVQAGPLRHPQRGGRRPQPLRVREQREDRAPGRPVPDRALRRRRHVRHRPPAT